MSYIEHPAITKELPPSPYPDRFLRGDARDTAKGTVVNQTTSIAARTYDAIVKGSGGGDFTSIEAAISYVQGLGGGSILIEAGTYTPTVGITINKPLNIVGVSPSLVTINFNNTSNNFTVVSQNIYTTGTITSIAGGVSVTGSGTSWLANVKAGYQIFLGTRWYTIAAVTGNTTLILAEAYADNLTMPGLAYRIANLTTAVYFQGMTIKSSTGTAINVTDCREMNFNRIVLPLNNKGIVLTNVSDVIAENLIVASSTSNGIELANCGLLNFFSVSSEGNGGHGFLLSTVKIASFLYCDSSSNTAGSGFNITSATAVALKVSASGNSAKGIELVATNAQVVMTELYITNNTSDGVKLTASSNYCKVVGGHFDTNGGWGVNVAVAGDTKNVVIGNSFNANTSGTVQDLGTGTISASNTA